MDCSSLEIRRWSGCCPDGSGHPFAARASRLTPPAPVGWAPKCRANVTTYCCNIAGISDGRQKMWPNIQERRPTFTVQNWKWMLQVYASMLVAVMMQNCYRTLRQQDTSDPHETLQHRCRSVSRHFGTKNMVRDTSALVPKCLKTLRPQIEESRDTSAPGQFGWDTSALVPKCPKILRHQCLRHFGTESRKDRCTSDLGLCCYCVVQMY